MRTIEKKWSGDVLLRHESFENYMEFYDTLMKRQTGAHKSLQQVLNQNDLDWIGCRSVQEAKDLFLKGWEKPLEQLKVQVDRELNTLENKRKQRVYANNCGFMPIIPNALMHLPNAMLDTKVEKVKSRVLRFCLSIDRGCGNSVESIIRTMSKQLAVIASLERTGKYRCRIEVFFTAFSGKYDYGRKYAASCSVLVKSENQLFDVKRLCYPIVNPSMLRLLMFGWFESLPLNYMDYYVSGYGKSFEHWREEDKKAFIDSINENNENIICLDLRSDAEEVLRKGGLW